MIVFSQPRVSLNTLSIKSLSLVALITGVGVSPPETMQSAGPHSKIKSSVVITVTSIGVSVFAQNTSGIPNPSPTSTLTPSGQLSLGSDGSVPFSHSVALSTPSPSQSNAPKPLSGFSANN